MTHNATFKYSNPGRVYSPWNEAGYVGRVLDLSLQYILRKAFLTAQILDFFTNEVYNSESTLPEKDEYAMS